MGHLATTSFMPACHVKKTNILFSIKLLVLKNVPAVIANQAQEFAFPALLEPFQLKLPFSMNTAKATPLFQPINFPV